MTTGGQECAAVVRPGQADGRPQQAPAFLQKLFSCSFNSPVQRRTVFAVPLLLTCTAPIENRESPPGNCFYLNKSFYLYILLFTLGIERLAELQSNELTMEEKSLLRSLVTMLFDYSQSQ